MKDLAGTLPRVPKILQRWFGTTVAAERLAAWRLGCGLALLFDILFFYVPFFETFFGSQGLAAPDVFSCRRTAPYWNWSILSVWHHSATAYIGLVLWLLSAVAILIGWHTRWAAVMAWILSLSFYNSNFYLHNSGDRLRHFLLILLMVAPADSAWCLKKRAPSANPVAVPAWPITLMLLQLSLMYFMNGIYKIQDPMWKDGSVLHYINYDAFWARWSARAIPVWCLPVLAWFTMVWEAGFPVWMQFRQTRQLALLVGVVFHLYTFFHLELAAFPLYALCLYLPLAPWECLARRTMRMDEGKSAQPPSTPALP